MTNMNGIENALQEQARKLQIPPGQYAEAQKRYHDITNYLSDCSKQNSLNLEIYIQGSFKIGTEIIPYRKSADADFDIDIVCCFDTDKNTAKPCCVKREVGRYIKENDQYNELLDKEGKKCWTLLYENNNTTGFHMDIVPAVPEFNNSHPQANSYHTSAIAVTDKLAENEYGWVISNPKAFAEWFREKNYVAFKKAEVIQKTGIFRELNESLEFGSIEDVPNIHVKTTLQKSIQLLKRHRDVFFSEAIDEEYKPISVIITTLAAKIYKNEEAIYDALKNIVSEIANYSKILDMLESGEHGDLITKNDNGEWRIENPVNEEENFAKNWHENNHARAEAFFRWIERVEEDFLGERFLAMHSEEINESYASALFQKKNETAKEIGFFNVPHKEPLKWNFKEDRNCKVTIEARYFKRRGGHSCEARMRAPKLESRSPIHKGGELEFKALVAGREGKNMPCQIFWQVVNTGKVAQQAKGNGDLRGDFYGYKRGDDNSPDFKTRKEYAEYKGLHWIQAFIIEDGVCIAKSEEFVVWIR